MSKTPRVGDTVIIKGIVKSVAGRYFTFTNLDEHINPTLLINRITEILPREPQVGDTVHKIGDILKDFNYEVIAIHGSGNRMLTPERTRRWAVCVRGDDIPQVFNVSTLECVD